MHRLYTFFMYITPHILSEKSNKDTARVFSIPDSPTQQMNRGSATKKKEGEVHGITWCNLQTLCSIIRQQEGSEEPELSSDFCEASLCPAPLIKGGEDYMPKTCLLVFTCIPKVIVSLITQQKV
jgi:hypothetical protein